MDQRVSGSSMHRLPPPTHHPAASSRIILLSNPSVTIMPLRIDPHGLPRSNPPPCGRERELGGRRERIERSVHSRSLEPALGLAGPQNSGQPSHNVPPATTGRSGELHRRRGFSAAECGEDVTGGYVRTVGSKFLIRVR